MDRRRFLARLSTVAAAMSLEARGSSYEPRSIEKRPLSLSERHVKWLDQFSSEIQIRETAGVRFGLLSDSGVPEPLPTMFVFAGALEGALDLSGRRVWAQCLDELIARRPMRFVSLDLPCHGKEKRPDEPGGIKGWRARVERGEDFAKDLTDRISTVVNHLIEQGYSDPDNLMVSGTSRGGFAAIHAAAAEPRFGAVVTFAPVTNLLVLTEFQGMESDQQVVSLGAENQVEKLINTSVWICIGHDDQRVGTDAAIRFSRRLVDTASQQKRFADVALHVLPSRGHHVPVAAPEMAAQWAIDRMS